MNNKNGVIFGKAIGSLTIIGWSLYLANKVRNKFKTKKEEA